MSTVAESPAPAAKANPLSDSLMAMIDKAHAEPAKADEKVPVASQQPLVPDPSKSTPPTGKAAQEKEGQPPKTEAKAEEKQAGEVMQAKGEKKVEEKKAPDPAETFKKRLNEQTAVNSRLGRELKEAQEQIKTLKQQMDGTYRQPAELSDEEKAAQAAELAEFQGRERVSRRIAFEKYGEEFVRSQIDGKDSPYGQLFAERPEVHYKVMQSDNPVEEALNQLGWHSLQKEHGTNHEQFLQSLKAQIRAEMMEEIKQQQAESSALVGKDVPGVGTARGAAEGREVVNVEEDFSLASIGSHFLD